MATVLVADDEEDLRSMVSEFLSESGYEVLVAANGLESLLHVKRARPSVVLLDLNMPRLGGLGSTSERSPDPGSPSPRLSFPPPFPGHDRFA